MLVLFNTQAIVFADCILQELGDQGVTARFSPVIRLQRTFQAKDIVFR